MNELIYIPRNSGGYFSEMFHLLNFFHRCEMSNSIPIIGDYVDNINSGYERFYFERERGYKNSFDQYFDINKIDYNMKYDKNFNYPSIENIIVRNGILLLDIVVNMELRNYVNFLTKKYLILRTEIQKRIDDIYFEKFNGKKILGVHIRKTDRSRDLRYTNDDVYFNDIDSIINDYDGLFLVSDNYQSINIFNQKYKDKSFYVDDIKRCEFSDIVHTMFIDDDDRYKQGWDVLIETYLLSKCHKNIITTSNISTFAICLNTNLKYHYLDCGIDN